MVRDPITSLDDDRVLELAADLDIGGVGEYEPAGAATLLLTEPDREVATATLDGADARVVLLPVRAGEDSVTAVRIDPDAADHPFGDVVRDA